MQYEEPSSERERLRRQYFSSVREISDIELQRRTWLDFTNSNPHWSFVEFVCSFPGHDQLCFSRDKGFLTIEEFELLVRLGRALDEYEAPGGDDWNNEAVLADLAWHSVVGKALYAKRQFLEAVSDPAERMHLTGRYDRFLE